MERFSQREGLLLGYSPQSSFMNSASSSPSTSNKNSDVDFHDVFGGPPRRSSIHETRYSFSIVTDNNALKRVVDDDDDEDDEAWSGSTEKPVFGDEAMNRRRTQSENFFDDIFRGNSSVSSSPRRLQRDPFSSAPGSRVLSPARPLPPKAEPSAASSLPRQFSLPTRLTKGVDLPTIGSTSRTTSLSRFSSQSIQSPEDLKNDIRSREFSGSGEGCSDLATSDKADTVGNLEQDSKSKESPTSSSPFQFHFSIYKWASKGVPIAMPLRRRTGSRGQKRTNNEEHSNTNECAANESMARQSPKSTLPNIDFPSDDHPLADADADARSPTLEPNKQENDLLLDESGPAKVEPCQFFEEAILPVAESEPFSRLHKTIEDVSGNTVSCRRSEDIEPYPLLETASGKAPQKESPVLLEQVSEPDLKPNSSLFFDDDFQQGNDGIFKVGGRKESVVKGTKKSSLDVGCNEIAKNQNGKRSSLTNVDVDKASFQGSPRDSRDNLGRSKVKGKVKDFVKMFNQEVLCKPAYDGDLGSLRYKTKEKGAFRAENVASISAARMSEDLQKSNVKSPFPNASVMMNEDLKQLEKEYCEAKTASYVLSNAPGQDVSASSTGSVPHDPVAITGDADECFLVKELTQDEKKQPQAGENHEEIQAIDAKIRQWSRGKEGNIRSLLTTMQYVLWPESGWKTVPLVDVIEGNSVKRAYQRALLCLHPDKLQQKGAASHQKYIAAKVFDILQEAWNHFNSLGAL